MPSRHRCVKCPTVCVVLFLTNGVCDKLWMSLVYELLSLQLIYLYSGKKLRHREQ